MGNSSPYARRTQEPKRSKVVTIARVEVYDEDKVLKETFEVSLDSLPRIGDQIAVSDENGQPVSTGYVESVQWIFERRNGRTGFTDVVRIQLKPKKVSQ